MEAISEGGSPLSLLTTSPTSAIDPTWWSANFKLNWKKEKFMEPRINCLVKAMEGMSSYVRRPEYTYLLGDLTILSSEHCCFLLTGYRNGWGSSFPWKTAQYRWKLQGSPGSLPSLPRKQREDEHSAAYAARLSLTMQTKCQDTRRAWTKGREAQTPGAGLCLLHLYFQITLVPVRREMLAGQKGPGSKRKCVGGAKASGETNTPE